MKELQVLINLTSSLQDLELLENFDKDCGNSLSNEVPTLNFPAFSGHAGYRLASERMGRVLTGEIPNILKEAVAEQKAVVQKCRLDLQKVKL